MKLDSNVGKLTCSLPLICTARERRMRLAGHCVRHPELAVSPLVLWEPINGNRSKGRREQGQEETNIRRSAEEGLNTTGNN